MDVLFLSSLSGHPRTHIYFRDTLSMIIDMADTHISLSYL